MPTATLAAAGKSSANAGRAAFRRVAGWLRPLARAVLGLRALDDAHRRVIERTGAPASLAAFFDEGLRELGVTPEVRGLERVPGKGALLVLANHPHGMLDGMLLAHALLRVRPDLKLLGNRWLARLPQLREAVIQVEPSRGGADTTSGNTAGMRAALRHLQAGGALVVFPAGRVAARSWRRCAVHDGRWSASIGRLQRKAEASTLPVRIEGRNSSLFQLAGLLHPRLRTLLLPRETLRQRGKTLRAQIGNPISSDQLAALPSDEQRIDYLRLRTELLSPKLRGARPARARRGPGLLASIAPALGRKALARDVARLLPSQRLASLGGIEAWYAYAPQIPHLLREIGRLRELTFREVGEGTGRAIDLDRFDAHYVHLFLWHAEQQQVIGAYRIGHVEHILTTGDHHGLYTSTLYDYDQRFLDRIGPALELGRSFVVREWQRRFQPLLLLWRGIASYVARHPDEPVLFGAVSISDRHSDVSKQLMLDHLRRHMHPELLPLVRARNPVRPHPTQLLPLRWSEAMVAELDQVDAMVAEIESERGGVPVLLREYLKLGGRLAGLNVDPDFGHAISALVVVDLRRADARRLSRYMGTEQAAQFFARHAPSTDDGSDERIA